MDDVSLKKAIERELEWEPKVDAAHIGVTVANGAVTLTGYVSTYSEKVAAVRAVERVQGVKAVADEIDVRLADADVEDDAAIAEAIANALRWNTLVPDAVKAEVRHGIVTLAGEVESIYQRDAAERAVRDIRGVKGVSNLVVVKPKATSRLIAERVMEAIKRSAELDANSIWVTTDNGTVHLHGCVRSMFEKRVAEEAAAAAPGISKVVNEIEVVP